jgi:hypothetical protein
MRYLNELEEAVGSLLAISVYENSLLVTMDWGEFAIHSPSTRSLELANEQLSPHMGKKVAILRDADATKPLRIRLATPHSEAIVGDYQR